MQFSYLASVGQFAPGALPSLPIACSMLVESMKS